MLVTFSQFAAAELAFADAPTSMLVRFISRTELRLALLLPPLLLLFPAPFLPLLLLTISLTIFVMLFLRPRSLTIPLKMPTTRLKVFLVSFATVRFTTSWLDSLCSLPRSCHPSCSSCRSFDW